MAATLRTTSLNLSARASLPSVRRRHYFPATRFPLPGDYSFRIQLNLPLARKYPFITVTPIRAQAKSYRGNGSENQFPEVPAKDYNWVKPILKFASDNFLPIGLTLRTEEIGAAAEAWPVALFGLASILFLTPLFSKIILLLRLQPQEFITGLAIFCCMPTTLSSGVALTRLAGGNSALALAMTVISSLIGILIIPFSISKLVASGVGVTVPTEQLMRSLVLTLLVPLILGKVFREIFKSLADFADQNRKLLSMANSTLLSLAPFIQVSRSRSLLLLVNPAVFLVAVVLGAVLHAMLFAFNAVAIQVLSSISGGSESAFAKKENASALLLVASQKTLPIMVAVAEQLGGGLGETGLLVLPCVAAHLNQIIIDSFVVNFWLQKDRATYNAKAA